MDAAFTGEFDAVVVASPTSLHHEHAVAALRAAPKVFVEKPLAGSAPLASELAASAGDRLMVGYNLRCHAPVRRFMELVHGGRCGDVLHARLWFGSFLPDWRPTVDYRTTYSARAELGGGILTDAIHELDLAIWLLPGSFTVRGALLRRVGPLEIDVEDVATALLEHESGAVVHVSLDYLSRAYRRGIEVVGTEATARLDWASASIQIDRGADREVEPATESVASSYIEQTDRFLRWVTHGDPPPVDGVEGARSVALADAIRAFT
jgi:predicted dehydrogenase